MARGAVADEYMLCLGDNFLPNEFSSIRNSPANELVDRD
jgi:hypothetical protein